jgi:uncharacterized protein YcgI (DUF1989 family)
MDEAISLDLDGKPKLRARIVRGAVGAARTGWADTVRAGLKIADPHSKQAGDFWAFNATNLDGHLPEMHARVCPRPGKSFHTNHRRPILQLVQGTCGVHDLLTAPCDERRYRRCGLRAEHASCAGNFRQVMAPFLGSVDCVMSKPWIDSVVALSACPPEFNPVARWYPADLQVDIHEAA